MSEVFLIVRRSPDVSPKLVEIKAVCASRELATEYREEIFEREGVVTMIEQYRPVDK